jgi:LPXTG-motif cell wall-anchored protein
MPTTGNSVDLWAPLGAAMLLALAGLALRRRSTARE